MSEKNLVFHVFGFDIIQRPVDSYRTDVGGQAKTLPLIQVGKTVSYYGHHHIEYGRCIEDDIFETAEEALEVAKTRLENEKLSLGEKIQYLQEKLAECENHEIKIKLYEDILKETATKEIKRLAKENKVEVSF
jgi:hypothetical protein